jgi:predicted RNA methylase
MKKVQLERTLQSLEPVARPAPTSEQYPTPAGIVPS